jgi:hypothetical protein
MTSIVCQGHVQVTSAVNGLAYLAQRSPLRRHPGLPGALSAHDKHGTWPAGAREPAHTRPQRPCSSGTAPEDATWTTNDYA